MNSQFLPDQVTVHLQSSHQPATCTAATYTTTSTWPPALLMLTSHSTQIPCKSLLQFPVGAPWDTLLSLLFSFWTPLTWETGPSTLPAQLPTLLTRAHWTGLATSSQPKYPSPTPSQVGARPFFPGGLVAQMPHPPASSQWSSLESRESGLFPSAVAATPRPTVPASSPINAGTLHGHGGKSLSGAETQPWQPQPQQWAGAHARLWPLLTSSPLPRAGILMLHIGTAQREALSQGRRKKQRPSNFPWSPCPDQDTLFQSNGCWWSLLPFPALNRTRDFVINS